MSILPVLLEMADHPLEDSFAYKVYPGQLTHPKCRRQQCLSPCSRAICKRQWPLLKPRHHHNRCTRMPNLNQNFEKDGFEVSMDTKEFTPEEIIVKTIDNTIIVEGKHEEKQDDHGHISRHFVRKYTLPKEVDINDVMSTRSSDGLLTIKAPPKPKADLATARVIEIQQTGQAHKGQEIETVGNEEKMAE